MNVAIRVWVLHDKTTHHFHLLADGGAIEIQSNEPTDAATQKAIRLHLAMIAMKFSEGDFAVPMFIHATVPPGVETMKQLKSEIAYKAENTELGAQLRIITHDAEQIGTNQLAEWIELERKCCPFGSVTELVAITKS